MSLLTSSNVSCCRLQLLDSLPPCKQMDDWYVRIDMAPNQQLVTVSLGESKAGELSSNFLSETGYWYSIGSVSLSALEEAFSPAALRILSVKELPANFQPLHINWLSAASYLARLSSEQLGRDENQPPKFECASSDADLSRSLDQSSSSLQCGLESRKGSLKSG